MTAFMIVTNSIAAQISLILIIVFYSIPSPATWGEAKYQAEYILPFALTGTWFVLQTFSRLNLMLVGKAIIFSLLVANIAFIVNFPSNCSPNHLVNAGIHLKQFRKKFYTGYLIQFSGSLIVATVMGLPTMGPLLLRALVSQDMYMAGSMLLILTYLTLVGTLISDLALGLMDPRIRQQ